MAQNNATDGRTDSQKIAMAEHFEDVEDEYRDDVNFPGSAIVYEDGQVVVVADHGGYELSELADGLGMPRSALSEMMHDLARQVCDYDWSSADPVVFDKFED